jgi:diaminohydroxyphosphoribosylaminopyrimidine deaminase / 5-amino-6-(5-phosphoribosylamino)uracil reductase
MDTNTHYDYMKLALNLAERGRLTVSPNPMVGCVIVKDNQIIGQGYHIRAGSGHAEVNAIQDAGGNENTIGATAYVTLEPCSHFGRTPPCTQALIKAGIKKVYVACGDANPLVAGRGVKELQAHGIEVETGILEKEARQLNEIFFKYITKRRPFVIAKWAMSLDGKTSTNPGDSRKISGEISHQHTHNTRMQVDAILVGSNTAICDDPELTVRYQPENITRHPLRVILSTNGNLPSRLKIFNGTLPGKTLIATTEPINADWQDKVEVLILPKNSEGQVCLFSLLDELGKREITSLLVEGGMKVHQSFFKENLVDQIQVYLAPVFIGTLDKKIALDNVKITPLGKDYHFSAACEEMENV